MVPAEEAQGDKVNMYMNPIAVCFLEIKGSDFDRCLIGMKTKGRLDFVRL